MLKKLNLPHFISQNVTERSHSLLAEDLFQYHEQLRAQLENKSLMVIGGAGTIGSSFIKAALKFKVSRLYVIDINENGLTELVRDLRSSTEYHIPDDLKTYPLNFGDAIFEKLLRKEGPFDIVANFAAHKHVRSEKDAYSIEAMLDNNVIKAKRLLDLLVEMPPKHFFCVSTDKAANPVNVMGASKKLMEEVILAYSTKIPISTARFANVAFSNGSLLAGFLDRIMKQQPLSSPLDIKRYFVSPQESGQICLIACVLGASGDIFFPKLSENQMKTFSEIAVHLLKELDYEPEYCASEEKARQQALKLKARSKKYPVYFFKSDTSGEKPYEEFYTGTEKLDMSSFKNLGVIKDAERKDATTIEKICNTLSHIISQGDNDKKAIVETLSVFIPDFKHIETGKSLDQKM